MSRLKASLHFPSRRHFFCDHMLAFQQSSAAPLFQPQRCLQDKTLHCFTVLLCFSLQDLCQLVNADAPYWLVGMTEMTRTFGLELLESVLNDFPGVFLQVCVQICVFGKKMCLF